MSDFDAQARRLDAAERAVRGLDPDARAAAEELAAALEDLHATVLRSLVTLLRSDECGRELLYRAVDDPAVMAALARAGLVRPPLALRAVQVLDAVRPYITSHGGDVELVAIDGRTAIVRLTGACQSCSSSPDTLRDLVAEALLEHLPELDSVVEEVPAVQEAFVPLSAVRRRS